MEQVFNQTAKGTGSKTLYLVCSLKKFLSGIPVVADYVGSCPLLDVHLKYAIFREFFLKSCL
jgi:hypothetical protein